MIFKYLRKKDWALIAICVVLIFFQVDLDLKIPGYMSDIITEISNPLNQPTIDKVMESGWPMLGCAFGSLVSMVIVSYIFSYIAAALSRTLRELEFNRVQEFSMSEINKFSISSLITRSTNDITQIQMAFAMGAQVVIKAPIMAIWAIYKIYNVAPNWDWPMATIIALVAMLVSIGLVLIYTIPKFKRIQWINDDVNSITKENIIGLRVVRAYNAENHEINKFKKANDDLTGTHVKITSALALMMPLMTLIMSSLSLAITWIGAYIVDETMIYERPAQIANMMTFTAYAVQAIMAFMMLIIIFMIVPRAKVAAQRVQEVINTKPSIVSGTEKGIFGVEGEIVFDNVCFKYPDAANNAIEGVSFEAKKGETIAFIGSTGAGKTTLVNLIPRFYDVTEGSVKVDGVDVRQYDIGELHKKIGYVPQKAQLFKGDIWSNINYGDSENDRGISDVFSAIDIAQCGDIVKKSDGHYYGKVAEAGTNLSGGQKQRISVARAVCRKPEIYIFDDTFSALDYKTDRILRSRLKKETAGITTLIVAQRIGTIMDADKIVVLNDGKMVGIGTHKELMDTCDVYREIAYSQLSEEELRR